MVSQGAEEEIVEEKLPLPEDTEHPIEQDDGLRVKVRTALSGLPKDQREVIELHWFEQIPFNEIATIVGASSGAVRVRAHRGYVALRKTLDPGKTGMPSDVL